MQKNEIYKTFNGELAYKVGKLEGFVDGKLSQENGIEYPYNYQTDIFYLGENNEISISQAMKDRFLNQKVEYWFHPSDKEKKLALINDFHINLVKDDNATVESAIYSLYDNCIKKKYGKAGKVKEAVRCVALALPVILKRKNVIGIYRADISKKEVSETLSIFYNYIPEDIVFIEYENYAVMFIFGLDD